MEMEFHFRFCLQTALTELCRLCNPLLDTLKQSDSHILLELKVLREGVDKLLEFTAFSRYLTMRVSKELHALLKVAHKAHLELQVLLIDAMQYQPKWLVNECRVAP